MSEMGTKRLEKTLFADLQETGNGHLRPNVAELCNEAEYHIVLLVKWLIANHVSVLIDTL